MIARLAIAVFLLGSATASAVTRDEVMVRARSFAFHPWRVGTANLTASCSSAYRSVYVPGAYRGLPYDWGGYMSAYQFDQRIKNGEGAGSYPGDGILSCTAGLDCSGFVSQAWGASHTTTRGMSGISTSLTRAQLVGGDVMNEAGYHVAMFSHRLSNGEPVFIEAVGYNVHVNATGGWSYVSTFVPLKYKNITAPAPAANPVGTTTNPIPITLTNNTFSDTRDTSTSVIDYLDKCGGATPASTQDESGPEFVYRLQVTRPGTLTVSLTDEGAADIDLHLLTQLNTNDCVQRHDSTFTRAVDCGTYYVVADTFVSSTGVKAGRYTMNVTFAPGTTTTCGSAGPPAYSFLGEPGDACAFPGNENLPFCNENVGSETCVYTSGHNAVSFCSHACNTNADCGAFPGGCCDELGSGEKYCMTSAFCGGGAPDAGPSTGGGIDAGFSDVDLDAGTPFVPDAGPRPDAGPPPVDAGTPPVDAGTPPVDAGTPPPVDAGTPPVDAGTSTPPDAGTTRDAGTPPRDAGTSSVDAGEEEPAPEPEDEDEGWGCATGGSAAFGWLVLLGRLRRRARSSRFTSAAR